MLTAAGRYDRDSSLWPTEVPSCRANPSPTSKRKISMQDRQRHNQRAAAARAGFSERTGRRIDADPRLPSQRQPEPGRTVPDPLARASWRGRGSAGNFLIYGAREIY